MLASFAITIHTRSLVQHCVSAQFKYFNNKFLRIGGTLFLFSSSAVPIRDRFVSPKRIMQRNDGPRETTR